MQNKQEELFHFGGDGGGVSIFKKQDNGIIKYTYHQSECFLDDNEDLQFINKTEDYDSFEEAFKQINDNYPWYSMVIEVSKEYKTYVLDQIKYSPNMAKKSLYEIMMAMDRAQDKIEEEEEFRARMNEDLD